MPTQEKRSLTPHFPTYAEARHFLRVLDGVPYALYRSMFGLIWSQRGTPQENVDWSDPGGWIPERLLGDEQMLALRIWRESDGGLNPRYLRGPWMLTQRHDLLTRDPQDVLQITGEGQGFLGEPNGPTVAAIDAYQGVSTVLGLLADVGPAKRSDIVPGFAEFCRTETKYDSESVIRHSLYDRLMNLIERQLVDRSGATYRITDAGMRYLEAHARETGRSSRTDQRTQLRRLARDLTEEARQLLAEELGNVAPYRFEQLIGFLLEEMGYTDVQVTTRASDKGVDVVANIELGITSVREVVQVKRHKGNIRRPILDQLRGSLHRFSAIQGTIITTGGFSNGARQAAFERGAAPITLIDGDKLVDLLIEHRIGMTRQSVEYVEFDASKLAAFDSEEPTDSLDEPPAEVVS